VIQPHAKWARILLERTRRPTDYESRLGANPADPREPNHYEKFPFRDDEVAAVGAIPTLGICLGSFDVLRLWERYAVRDVSENRRP
jgi:hypothetical protein